LTCSYLEAREFNSEVNVSLVQGSILASIVVPAPSRSQLFGIKPWSSLLSSASITTELSNDWCRLFVNTYIIIWILRFAGRICRPNLLTLNFFIYKNKNQTLNTLYYAAKRKDHKIHIFTNKAHKHYEPQLTSCQLHFHIYFLIFIHTSTPLIYYHISKLEN
jgi:hypothetical protein